MLMAVNVGNERISVGFFEKESSLVFKFEVSTVLSRTEDEYYAVFSMIARERGIDTEGICAGVVSSVVPQLSRVICETVKRFTGEEPVIVGAGVKTGFAIKIDSPSELGGDMVANAAAVISRKKKGNNPCAAVIVDMGAVTTVSAINPQGEFVGCSIFPGVRMSLDALHGNTAQLPNVSCVAQTRAIGKNSQESVLSGVLLGHAITLDGFVFRFVREMKVSPESVCCIATGEYAERVMPLCHTVFEYDKDLTLEGLYHIYQKSKENKPR